MKDIIIRGAREHNLKNINVTLPREKFIVITGLSGSGKSTLAFDTLYAEGQRRYVESLSAYARQFLGLMNKPDVDSIEGLSPAISIEQKTTSSNPRSTVGTVTEIYDYLRLLFARVGIPHCPEHKIKIESQTAEKIANKIAEEHKEEITILAPIVRQKKGTYEKLIEDLSEEGFARVRVNGKIYRTDEKVKLQRYKKHDIEAVIDRIETTDKSRLIEATENALKRGEGLIFILDSKDQIHTYSSLLSCPVCGMSFEELQPRMFSFNSPFGACDECKGLGVKIEFSPDLVIPDKNKSIMEGAIAIYGKMDLSWRGQQLQVVAKKHGFDIFTKIKDLTEKQLNVLLYGHSGSLLGRWSTGASMNFRGGWEGIIPQSERLYKTTQSEWRKHEFEKYMSSSPCPKCFGKRLKDKILAVTVHDKSIIDLTDLSITKALEFFKELELTKRELEIAKLILKEIISRLNFLNDVGLGYLNMSRMAGTLSGGEAQRVKLATELSKRATGRTVYILDEPTTGLHFADIEKLLTILDRLVQSGNTVIVIEHNMDVIINSDWVIDLGPEGGEGGGTVVAHGTPEQIITSQNSYTGKHLKEVYRRA